MDFFTFANFLLEKKSVKEIVKRKDWQSLREKLKGTWTKTPTSNVSKLRKWLGPIRNTSDDKLRIVMNYLTGTGFRTGKIKHESISKLREQISKELKRRKEAK